MRKVTETIVDAFLSHRAANCGNSSTDGEALFLHGHKIASHGEHNGAAGVFLTLAGWNTPTTKERLRGVLTMMGHQAAHVDGRPVLNIWSKCARTYIGIVKGAALTMRPTDVVFVAHPAAAKGMDALAKVEG